MDRLEIQANAVKQAPSAIFVPWLPLSINRATVTHLAASYAQWRGIYAALPMRIAGLISGRQ
jgi:hypothetical protein